MEWVGGIEFSWTFFQGFISIVLIDLVLAGDKAIVIAMAVANLPRFRKIQGIILGAGAAVLIRVIFTFFVAQLLMLPYLKMAGGALILWIAVKLLLQSKEGKKSEHEVSGKDIIQAIKTIAIADLVMSTDNILAVAGASKGNLVLLLFGLGLSIPLVVGSSTLLSYLMDRFPWIITLGAGVLGWVGGEMIITDPFVHNALGASFHFLTYPFAVACAISVILVGNRMGKKKSDITPSIAG